MAVRFSEVAQAPNLAALGVAAADKVSGLYGDFVSGYASTQKLMEDNQIRGARQSLADLGENPTPDQLAGAANRLMAAGDVRGAQALADLGLAQEDRAFRRAQAETDAAWKERTFAADQEYKNRYLGIMGDRASNREVPSGYQPSPDGGLMPIPGGPADPKTKIPVREKAPSGYRWSAADPSQLEAIPGGPGEKIAAETAARIGLAQNFLNQVDDIRSRVKEGQATGPVDYAMGAAGRGKPGELHRMLASGAEALMRNLTGAGMNLEEARAYANRYQPTWRDDATTLDSKLTQLEGELRNVMQVVGRGRGGNITVRPTEQPAPTPTFSGPRPSVMGAGPADAAPYTPPLSSPASPTGKNTDRMPQGTPQARAAGSIETLSPGSIVVQGGVRYQKQPDGSFVEVR